MKSEEKLIDLLKMRNYKIAFISEFTCRYDIERLKDDYDINIKIYGNIPFFKNRISEQGIEYDIDLIICDSSSIFKNIKNEENELLLIAKNISKIYGKNVTVEYMYPVSDCIKKVSITDYDGTKSLNKLFYSSCSRDISKFIDLLVVALNINDDSKRNKEVSLKVKAKEL